jgi:hypothetical protein
VSGRRTSRRSRSQRHWRYERFSARHLGERLHAQLFGILELDECTALADAVSAELSARLTTRAPHSCHRPQEGHPELETTPRFLGVLSRQDKATSLRHFITLEQIRDLVLEELDSIGKPPGGGGGSARFRAAHVVYALSTHGGIEPAPAPREGADSLVEPGGVRPSAQWRTVGEFLGWLEKNYGDLPPVERPQEPRQRGADEWWRPISSAPAPSFVVKRHKKLRRRGITQPHLDPRKNDGQDVLSRAVEGEVALAGLPEPGPGDISSYDQLRLEVRRLREENAALHADREARASVSVITPALAGVPYEPFIRDKLVTAVAGALAGRGLNEDEATENVVAWVLWTLAGQEVVLSSQIGAAVAECLRRVDDIAYLRWVIVAKELRVTSIQREVAGMVNYPSKALLFRRASIRTPTPNTPPDEYGPDSPTTVR